MKFFFWLYCTLFCLAFTQTQNYAGNQHTYFSRLYGQLGIGHLEHDWFAQSYDFVVLFNQLGTFTLQYLTPQFFYVYNLLICVIYFYALTKIVATLFPTLAVAGDRNPKLHFFWTCLIFFHAIAPNYVNIPFLDIKLFSLFFGGFAHSSALHRAFMPSCFGVLFFLATALFLQAPTKKYAMLASFFLALGAAFHLNSLTTAVFVGAAFVWVQFIYYKSPIYLTFICLAIFAIIVLPCLLPHFQNFLEEDKSLVAQATEIYTKIRVAHHTDVANKLLSLSAFVQFAVVIAGLYIAKNHKPLFYILLLPFIGSMILAVVQVITESSTLAATQTIRSATFYIPICSVIVLGRGIEEIGSVKINVLNLGKLIAKITNFIQINLLKISLLSSILLAISGIVKMYLAIAHRKYEASYQIYEKIRIYHQQTPPPLYLVAPDNENFRLTTLQPMVADWKNHPLKSAEMLEWYKRYLLVKGMYDKKVLDCQAITDFKKQYPISHILLDSKTQIDCEKAVLLFEVKPYRVYRLDF
jgi:hypothetical protein